MSVLFSMYLFLSLVGIIGIICYIISEMDILLVIPFACLAFILLISFIIITEYEFYQVKRNEMIFNVSIAVSNKEFKEMKESLKTNSEQEMQKWVENNINMQNEHTLPVEKQ